MKDPMEVCSLSRGVMLLVSAQLLSSPLQGGLRFFHIPLPAFLSAFLTVRFPNVGRKSGLPCSALRTERVRCSLSTGSLCAHDRGARSPCTSYFAFWLKLFSIFSLLRFTVFIKSSRLLTIPSTLAPLRLMLADPSFPHRSDGGFLPWLHCQRAFDRLLPPCFTS
jgi:hypothetical protein